MTKKKLTEEDIPEWPRVMSGELAEEWIKIGLSESPRVKDEDVFKFVREVLELEINEVVWAESIVAGGRAARLRAAGVKLPREISRAWVERKFKSAKKTPPIISGHARYGQWEWWLSWHMAFRGTDIDLTPSLLYEPIVRGSNWWFLVEGTAIMTPTFAPKLDANGDLHCEDGPCMPDVYALHGIVLPLECRWLVTHPKRRTRKNIDKIENAEVRRVAIATWPEAYVQGEPMQRDEFGELYKLDDAFSVVRVLDASTPRVYWLRVPPETKTAHEGVAWSFGFDKAEDYRPQVQT